MKKDFFKSTSLIEYSKENYHSNPITSIDEIDFGTENKNIRWLNTYGTHHKSEFKAIVTKSLLDDFLLKLITEEKHPNKVLELDNALFVTIKVLKTETKNFQTEQMFFVLTPHILWSIQEEKGDYFEWIRERIRENKGIVRNKKTDYLLFLILESIIDNYEDAYDKISSSMETLNQGTDVKPTPEFTQNIEKEKNILITFKKAATSLRDIITKLEKVEQQKINKKFYSELSTQIHNLLNSIDFDLQEMESKINLIFSIQGHRLNEVMKTLTIFSVIFIPLTFLAGIYGMNFEYIPELKHHNGYFVLLGVMVIVTLGSIYYFRKKKWF
ncbi:magnesium and cobalt transport protein CorA [Wenyingzhuangia marina]|uniref:Magnesium transporter n=1 Tax=Wenyingzhuangia marina TaxID=1195760 RepID=A0A1M5WFD0_9FLAO|nr:magnesium and cobalt transport protein CorA [Wenyingzhuangia marina]GGF81304.1 magnesium transport protein CorA [Wenyingzhuangia marina]SHH86196.1 magnesium transporter [Wenyingzhuangia marina]